MQSDSSVVVNEVFYSIQGEGRLSGVAMVFVRFTGCNMRCDLAPGPRSPGGFACDTEFESGRRMDIKRLLQWIEHAQGKATPSWVLLTGGEPALQVTPSLLLALRDAGYRIAIETNGSLPLPTTKAGAPPPVPEECDEAVEEVLQEHFAEFDWITVSPKVAEHAIRQRWAHEVKYVRGHGQAVPSTKVRAVVQSISPAFAGQWPDTSALDWCLQLVKDHPEWSLTTQAHKLWRIR